MDTRYLETPEVVLYHGDVLTILAALSLAVDVVVADPPYSSGGRSSSERARPTRVKYQSSDAKKKLPNFTGDSRDQHGHTHWCALWLAAALRSAAPTALAFVWTDWRQLAATSDALQAGGWTWRGVTIWDKTRRARPVRGRFRLDTEFTIWGSNGDMPDAREVYPSSIITAAAPTQRAHTAQKPIEAYRHLLSIAAPGGTLLDPFTGSGSALLAAREAGFRAIGIEIDERYCEIAARRLAGELP